MLTNQSIGYIDAPIPKGLDLKEEINRMRREKNAVILAHYYQTGDIQDIADFVGVGLMKELLSPVGGIVNKIIEACGGNAINFFSEAGWFRTMYIGSSLWQGTGYNAIIYLAALAGIDMEQYEAARIDGATRFQKIIYITLPGIMPRNNKIFWFSGDSSFGCRLLLCWILDG
mgnify:CR=1 FL=1